MSLSFWLPALILLSSLVGSGSTTRQLLRLGLTALLCVLLYFGHSWVRWVFIALLAAVAFLPGLVARLRRGPMLEVAALKQHLDAGEDLLLLDVRKPEEFTGELGHIEGARNLPLDSLNERIEELAAWQERPVMLVCHTDKRSAKAARILARKGFARLHVVAGGMVAWNAAGLPTRNRHPRPGE